MTENQTQNSAVCKHYIGWCDRVNSLALRTHTYASATVLPIHSAQRVWCGKNTNLATSGKWFVYLYCRSRQVCLHQNKISNINSYSVSIFLHSKQDKSPRNFAVPCHRPCQHTRASGDPCHEPRLAHAHGESPITWKGSPGSRVSFEMTWTPTIFAK